MLEKQQSFPQDKKEVAQARTNLVKMIHSEKIQAKIVTMMQPERMEQAVGEVAQLIAMMISKIITKIKGQLGRKVHIKLIDMLIKLAIQEVNRISSKLGIGEMPKEASNALLQATTEALKKLKQGGQPGQPEQMGPGQGQGMGPQQGQQMQPQGILSGGGI